LGAIETFYAKGKLLLTGEYLVLDGAHALACPTVHGQKMTVVMGRGSEIKWKSLDQNGNEWFSARISLFDFKCEKTTDQVIGDRLTQILTEAVRLNSDFLSKWNGLKVETACEFPLNWGLGTSSTLIYCMAQWADVDPFDLYSRTFGGSGYDIACADANGPIFYHVADHIPIVEKAQMPKKIRDQLYFIYTGKKQDTQGSIAHYRSRSSHIKPRIIDDVSSISEEITHVNDIKQTVELIENHESILSEVLGLPKIKTERFPDYWGAVKSLGAWGGDFALATSERSREETSAYFNQKGHDVVMTWDEMMAG
jgi:mevalonate kinase